MRLNLSILNLYRYDNTLFDNLTVPTGIDADKVVNDILRECSDFELVYPDADFMKDEIGEWSAVMSPIWEKLYKTTILSYNPIENYNRSSNWTDTYDLQDETTFDSTEERTADLENKTTYDSTQERTPDLTEEITYDSSVEDDLDGSETTSVQGYNVAGFVNQTKVEEDRDNFHNKTGTDTTTTTGTDTTTHTGTDTLNTTGTDTYAHTGSDTLAKTGNVQHYEHMSGNIGVTTTQQMIEQERKISLFNIYEHIVNNFKTEFCILLY